MKVNKKCLTQKNMVLDGIFLSVKYHSVVASKVINLVFNDSC